MEEYTDISIYDVIITLDNAPIHCSIKTKAWAAKLRLSLEWLPPYTPNFAPVEKCSEWRRQWLHDRRIQSV